MRSPSRRLFLSALAGLIPLRRIAAAQAPLAGARLLGTVELAGPTASRRPPLDTLLGDGLDARLFTDLSALSPASLITPNDRFFVRTAAPSSVRRAEAWKIRLGGSVRNAHAISLETLRQLAHPAGTHLVECAGNSNPWNFGMLSAADWDGVPVAALLDRLAPRDRASRILISGVDEDTQSSQTSVPGASWIFARDDLERAGAFLALRMNGAALPANHGSPVRLFVPGWYGCACIQWVDRIDLVADDAPATSQMLEYASRTHQNGKPPLARDFAPALIDLAAMPVRVEKWILDGRLVYRIVGVMWGGSKPTNALQIRFRTGEPFVPVSDCSLPATTATWSLWSHVWRPPAPRRYQIVLRVADPTIRTRRLDLFFYVREVQIDEA